jgi:hypothetical protein
VFQRADERWGASRGMVDIGVISSVLNFLNFLGMVQAKIHSTY